MIFLSYLSFGQKVITFSEMKNQKSKISTLDSIFSTAIQIDSSKCVFGNRRDEYNETYFKYMVDLRSYLLTKGIEWDTLVVGHQIIYFNKNGQVEYFIYSFDDGLVSKEKEALFRKLVFISENKMKISADSNFQQCGTIYYSPKTKK